MSKNKQSRLKRHFILGENRKELKRFYLKHFALLFFEIALLLVVLLAFFSNYSITGFITGSVANGYKFQPGDTLSINTHGFDLKLVNEGTKTHFVPTKTLAGLTSFINHLPSGVSIEDSVDAEVSHVFNLNAGTPAVRTNFNLEAKVKEIELEVNRSLSSIEITVIGYDGRPSGVATKTGPVYKYLQIEAPIALGNALEKATVTVQVEKSWVTSNNMTRSQVSVFKLNETSNRWLELLTDYSSQDSTNYYYEVELKSFSYFAIGKETPVQNTSPVTNLQNTGGNVVLPNVSASVENTANLRARDSGSQANELPEANFGSSQDANLIYILIIAILVAAIIFTSIKLIGKKHENPHHSENSQNQ